MKTLSFFVFVVALLGQTVDVSPRRSASVTFANLGTPANGTQVYCSDCAVTNPCASGGSGNFARRENGAWNCQTGSGVTVYPSAGITQSTGSAWGTPLTLDTDGTLAANSDTKVPSQKAVKTKIDALNVFYGLGTYSNMTAAAAAAPTNAMWMMTDATSTGLCGSGGGLAKAVCVKNNVGTWDSIVASGGGGTTPGPTTTVYGGWTGGGATVTVTDSDCATGDDTAAVQAKLNSLANNGTLDFTGTTNTCDINDPGLVHTIGWTNVRITQSGTKGLKGISSTCYQDAHECALIYIEDCTNCLIDKLEINSNTTKGAFYAYSWNNSSIQNMHVHNVADGTTGPYAGIKCDNCVDIWIANNNVHDTGGVSPDVTGVRGIWCGVDVGRYCTRPTIISNTVANTGHTGIASEGQQIVMSNNTVSNILTQGTGLKMIPRGVASDNVFEGNSVTSTYNAGWQYDGSGTVPLSVSVRNNTFKDTSLSGCCFGAMYIANTSAKNNVQFTGNTLINGRQVANIGYATNVLLQNNTIVTPGSGGTEIGVESNAHDIVAINSGTVIIQGGCTGTCSNLRQDGAILLATLPINRDVIFAMNYAILKGELSE